MKRALMTVRACLGALAISITVVCPAFAQAATQAPVHPDQWRLQKESVGADSKESFVQGADVLYHPGALEAAGVTKLFFYGKLLLLPAGTMVKKTGDDGSGATRVEVLEGPQSGKTVWLFSESAEKLGFLPSPETK